MRSSLCVSAKLAFTIKNVTRDTFALPNTQSSALLPYQIYNALYFRLIKSAACCHFALPNTNRCSLSPYQIRSALRFCLIKRETRFLFRLTKITACCFFALSNRQSSAILPWMSGKLPEVSRPITEATAVCSGSYNLLLSFQPSLRWLHQRIRQHLPLPSRSVLR